MAREKGLDGGGRPKALVLFMLVLGIVLGALFSVYLIYPVMNQNVIESNKVLIEKNQLLERQVDAYLVCFGDQGIDPDSCTR